MAVFSSQARAQRAVGRRASQPGVQLRQRFARGVITIALIVSALPVAAFLPAAQLAQAAPVAAPQVFTCAADSQGADEVPGQKDLTYGCVDTSDASSVSVSWNWDDTSFPGNNTGDACSLFDNDGDGYANYAVCVQVGGNAPTSGTVILYTCSTDTRTDRCVGSASVPGPYANLICTVVQANTNPFDGGTDTVATCTIPYVLVGGATASYLDVCSYPSPQPNSDPSDCVRNRPSSGRLEVRKVLVPSSDPGRFNLLIGGVALTGNTNVGDGGTTGEQIVTVGNGGSAFSISETPGTNTLLFDYASSILCKDQNGTGATVASNSNAQAINVTVNDRDDIVCTITNTRKTGAIKFVKNVLPTGSALPSAWTFDIQGGPQDIAHDATVTLNTGTYAISEDGGANNANYELTAAGGACTLVEGAIQLTVTEAGGTCTLTNARKNTTLLLAKAVNSTPAIAGRAISFTITADNQGAIAANDVTISDPTPAGLTLLEVDSTQGDCSAFPCALGTIGAGLSASVLVTYQVPAGFGAQSIVNNANATTSTPLINSSLTAQATVPVIHVADLSVLKDNAVSTYTPGVATSYRITVSNAGPSDVTGATLTDALPGQISSWTWTCDSQTGGASGCSAVSNSTADFADTIDLPVSGQIVYVVNATIPPSAAGLLNNAARIAAPSGVTDPVTGNNEDADVDEPNPLADLSVTKTDNAATYTPGLPTTYEIVISNAGPSDASVVSINDAIPAQVASWTWTCEAVTGGASDCTPAASNTAGFNDSVSLPAGGSIRYKVVAQTRSSATGDLINSALVSAPIIVEVSDGVTDPNPGNNQATDTDQAAPRSTIQVGKTDKGASATASIPRDHIVYTIYVTNTGPSDAAAITLNEVVPAFTFYDAVASSAGWSCADNAPSGSACALTIGPLAAGASTSRSFGLHVVSALPAGVVATTNTVTVTGSNLVLPPPASDTTPLIADAELTLSKTDNRINVQPGNVLTYVLTLNNTGSQESVGIVLEDTLPANTTFVSANAGGVFAAGKVSWSIPSLLARREITREVVVRVNSPFPPNVALITNSARVTDDGQNGDTAAGNIATDVDNVISAADISLTKTDDDAIAVPGQPVVYTIVTTNNGDQSTGEFIITETVPANTVFDPVNSTNGWACVPNNNAGSVCTIKHPTLAGGGGTLVKRFVVNVVNPLPIGVTILTNTVTVDGSPINPKLTVTETTPVCAPRRCWR
jgi:uncharacterized repeat protein (TIGR01451 family)